MQFAAVTLSFLKNFVIWGGISLILRSLVVWDWESNPADWGIMFRAWMTLVLMMALLSALGKHVK